MTPPIHIGTMGWNYPAWVGPFYPPSTKPGAYLAMYAKAFDTVEVDSTFYAIPPKKNVTGWRDRTPDGFVFALKLPQEITHERRLRDSGELLVQFIEVARELGPKLGPILVQCGPDFGVGELPSLKAFLPLLPPDLDFAIEFRQRGWITEEVIALLKDHRVALAASDGRWIPRDVTLDLFAEPTADFRYVRLMGPDQSITDFSHVQVDRSDEVREWATLAVDERKAVMRTHFHINNHYTGHSPATARMMMEALGMKTVLPSEMGDQLGLF